VNGAELVGLVIDELQRVSPRALTARALERDEARTSGPVVLVCAGKAASPMAEAAFEVLGGRVVDACIVHPKGSPAPRLPKLARAKSRVFAASHPLPDGTSIAAARAALELAERGPSDSELVVLVSGGASALLCGPASPLELAGKRRWVARLLASGAPIDDVNLVRAHLSTIKGGGLLRAAFPRRVKTYVVSDVIGGSPSDVGSGPSLPVRRGLRAARRIAREWLGTSEAEELPLQERVLVGSAEARCASARLLVSPESFARAVVRRLRLEGRTASLRAPLADEITRVAERLDSLAEALQPGEIQVFASECTLALPPTPGRGGRAGHLAALVGPRLPRGVHLVCLATDGRDGSSGYAGASVRRDSFRGELRATRNALLRADTGPLHERLGTAIHVPLGHNLADLIVLARR
jgi:glycerate 2-kinase